MPIPHEHILKSAANLIEELGGSSKLLYRPDHGFVRFTGSHWAAVSDVALKQHALEVRKSAAFADTDAPGPGITMSAGGYEPTVRHNSMRGRE